MKDRDILGKVEDVLIRISPNMLAEEYKTKYAEFMDLEKANDRVK